MESNRRYVLSSYICKAAEAREIFSQFRTGAVRFKKPVLYCIAMHYLKECWALTSCGCMVGVIRFAAMRE